MSNYYVAILGFSSGLKGPFPDYDKAVEVAEDHVVRHRVKTLVVKEMGSCEPLPTEVEWKGLK